MQFPGVIPMLAPLPAFTNTAQSPHVMRIPREQFSELQEIAAEVDPFSGDRLRFVLRKGQ